MEYRKYLFTIYLLSVLNGCSAVGNGNLSHKDLINDVFYAPTIIATGLGSLVNDGADLLQGKKPSQTATFVNTVASRYRPKYSSVSEQLFYSNQDLITVRAILNESAKINTQLRKLNNMENSVKDTNNEYNQTVQEINLIKRNIAEEERTIQNIKALKSSTTSVYSHQVCNRVYQVRDHNSVVGHHDLCNSVYKDVENTPSAHRAYQQSHINESMRKIKDYNNQLSVLQKRLIQQKDSIAQAIHDAKHATQVKPSYYAQMNKIEQNARVLCLKITKNQSEIMYSQFDKSKGLHIDHKFTVPTNGIQCLVALSEWVNIPR